MRRLQFYLFLSVPEPPLQIKAAALTADSILVSWLPPKHKNGNILHYTVYSREAGKKGQARSVTFPDIDLSELPE